jgi:hypothetical protein
MARAIPFLKTLGAKLGGIGLALTVVALLFIAGNLMLLSSIQGDGATIGLFDKGGMYAYEMIYIANRLFDESPAKRADLERKLDRLI